MQAGSENEYRGYSLFNGLEDKSLQCYNRARILSNMSQDNVKGGRITPKGAALVIGYFNQFNDEDRKLVLPKFKEMMIKEGFHLVNPS
jgi:hypothetical protein